MGCALIILSYSYKVVIYYDENLIKIRDLTSFFIVWCCIGSRTQRLFLITYYTKKNTRNTETVYKQSLKNSFRFYCSKTIYTTYTLVKISVGLTWNCSVFICTRLHISSYLSRSCCGMFSLFIPLQLLYFLYSLKIYTFFSFFCDNIVRNYG